MKNPLHYQFSEYDCGPTTMQNAISFLFEREEIPPEILRNIDKLGFPANICPESQSISEMKVT